jgi:hypothetical protein
MNLRPIALLVFLLPVLFSCRKSEPEEIDLGYDYFPMQVGNYVVYRVDSTYFGTEPQTFSFQLREVLAYEFIDGQGEPAVAVERYRRPSNDEPWTLHSVWVQKRTPTSGQRLEENVRFIRMAFPVAGGKSWNGNAYNTLPAWQYVTENPDQPVSYGALDFPRSVRISQRNNVNLVDQEIAFEVYARNVGLVYKRFTDLRNQGGQLTGVDYTLTAIAYGKEP